MITTVAGFYMYWVFVILLVILFRLGCLLVFAVNFCASSTCPVVILSIPGEEALFRSCSRDISFPKSF